ncbi:hypothetical protein KXW41_000584, partial [Aspergillus fumigatus]
MQLHRPAENGLLSNAPPRRSESGSGRAQGLFCPKCGVRCFDRRAVDKRMRLAARVKDGSGSVPGMEDWA